MLQNCNYFCDREIEPNDYILNVQMTEITSKKYMHTYEHILHQTLNKIILRTTLLEPVKSFIKIAALYIIHCLRHKPSRYFYLKEVFKKKFIVLGNNLNNLNLGKIHCKIHINVNNDMLEIMTLIRSCDNIYQMTYYIRTYAMYVNICIINYYDIVVRTYKDEMKMSILMRINCYYSAIITFLFGCYCYTIIKTIYCRLEWLPFYKYFTIFKYKRKKHNE